MNIKTVALSTTLYIKNMVCVRCKMAVQSALEAHHIPFLSIELGRVKLPVALADEQLSALGKSLKYYELELMQDRKKILVERIKTKIIGLLASPEGPPLKLSAYLSEALGYKYTYLANTFSELEGTTLERYFINSRVERAKELMVYEEMPLGEIADELRYSNVSHLCLQFKKVTGLTPAEFKKHCQSDDFVWRRC